jgi:GntR family transcriptional regulator, transcriptional repressor for pyruvate dehydrogenase complex
MNPHESEARLPANDPVATQVVHHIRGLIESGKLARGERLPAEREFAKDLKVSRASLRAGVGYLAAMGVLRVRHGVGTFVADGPPALSAASFEMMSSLHGFTARLVLEGSIAALAAERGTPLQLAQLDDVMAELQASQHDPAEYLIHDVRFHRLLGEAAGNPILAAMMETVSASFYDTRRSTVSRAADLESSTAAHRAIHRAVRSRDAGAARELMEQHLRHAEKSLAAEASAQPVLRVR